MMRRKDWPLRLDAYMRRTWQNAFSWGSHDCGTWACGAVDAMCDSRLLSEFEGRYVDKAGALTLLTTRSWATMLDAVVACTETEPLRDPCMAIDGDVIWIPPGRFSPEPTLGTLGIYHDVAAWAPATRHVMKLRWAPVLATGARVIPLHVPGRALRY
jgi:hypothetical protein